MVTRNLYEEDHEDFRRTVAAFYDKEVVPHQDRWEEQGVVDRSMWKAAAEAGVIGFSLPEQYGGGGVTDYRFEMVRGEESAHRGIQSSISGWGVSDGIVPGYLTGFGSEHLQEKYLPGLAAGDLIGAIAMTEPEAGSDLQNIRTKAVKDGDDWVIDGAKTFITNGQTCDFVIVVAKTDPDARGSRGTSLFIIDDGTPGFTKGRKLDKVGLAAQDTSELSFESVRVPGTQLLGELNNGFIHLMTNLPYERMGIASGGLAGARAAFHWTADYVFSRQAYGATIGDLQATQFELAELEARIDMLEAYVDRCALALNAGTLTAIDASKAKMLGADLQIDVVTRGLQLHGGYGYILEYPIARAFRDSRIQSIYGGTSEVMKHIIGKDIRSRYRQDR
ncbi:acyl-CoA dehydrogenase family protein [Brevibacterium jeotgali]|uniref:Long-chain-acyl-CoA dehydrogenase n=1 Tax=Brevibacterium jeotgali TaxID=1262550 RepID=A0A2H1L4D0_9MICO|nr:acyl-CoA dehydrogenase family protein [Brevibacterium jeotgali]TWB98780.1 long-chain-acyl-CoA dehydrogenase [Brevibacterium jeotgali]SMY11620.1 long-chain-acyl-CoA dehydrogenase [Brevibacterium jeotgali]